MKTLYDIDSIRERVREIILDGSLTHEQQMMQLAMQPGEREEAPSQALPTTLLFGNSLR